MDRCQDVGEIACAAHYNVRQVLFGRNYRSCDNTYLSGCRDDFDELVDRMSKDPYNAKPLDATKPANIHRHDWYYRAHRLNMQVNRFDDHFEVIEKCPYHDGPEPKPFPYLGRNPYDRPHADSRSFLGTKSTPTNSSFGHIVRRDLPGVRHICMRGFNRLPQCHQALVRFAKAALNPDTGKYRWRVTCHECDTVDKEWNRGPDRAVWLKQRGRVTSEGPRDNIRDEDMLWFCSCCWEKRNASNSQNNGDTSNVALETPKTPVKGEIDMENPAPSTSGKRASLPKASEVVGEHDTKRARVEEEITPALDGLAFGR